MGLIRKTMSVGTIGMVDWKSDKERTAASARKTKSAVRKGNRQQAAHNARMEALMREQNELLRTQQQSGAPKRGAAQKSDVKPWF